MPLNIEAVPRFINVILEKRDVMLYATCKEVKLNPTLTSKNQQNEAGHT